MKFLLYASPSQFPRKIKFIFLSNSFTFRSALLYNETLASSRLPDFLNKNSFSLTKILLEVKKKKKKRVSLSEFFPPFFSRWSNWIAMLCGFTAVAFQDVRCCYGAKSHIHRHPFHHVFISDLSYATLITNSLLAVHKHLHILSFYLPLPLRMPIIPRLQLLM